MPYPCLATATRCFVPTRPICLLHNTQTHRRTHTQAQTKQTHSSNPPQQMGLRLGLLVFRQFSIADSPPRASNDSKQRGGVGVLEWLHNSHTTATELGDFDCTIGSCLFGRPARFTTDQPPRTGTTSLLLVHSIAYGTLIDQQVIDCAGGDGAAAVRRDRRLLAWLEWLAFKLLASLPLLTGRIGALNYIGVRYCYWYEGGDDRCGLPYHGHTSTRRNRPPRPLNLSTSQLPSSARVTPLSPAFDLDLFGRLPDWH